MELPPKVVETLLVLVEKHGEIVGKQELMDRLWPHAFVEEANLVQNIYLLRKTLGTAENGEELIKTFRRRGYCFTGEIKSRPEREGGENGRPSGQISPAPVFDERTQIVAAPDQYGSQWSSRPVLTTAAVFLGLVLVFVGLGAWRSLDRKGPSTDTGPAKLSSISFKRLTPDMYAINPTISPDGKYMVSSRRQDSGDASVWLTDMVSGAEKQIMPANKGGYDSFRFSPDGSEIFMITYGTKEPKFVLGRIPLTGGQPHEVARNFSSPFTLSPDGRQVAFVRDTELVIADAGGGGERAVARRDSDKAWFASWSSQMSWSPGGDTIAIAAGRLDGTAKRAELLEISVTDGAEHEIPIPNWDSVEDVLWRPDHSGLLVTARETSGSPFQIWLVSYPSGEAHRVTQDINDYDSLSITADSQVLVAGQVIAHRNIYAAPLANTKEARQLTFGTAANDGYFGVVALPDGKIIYTSARGGSTDLWMINADGSDQRQITATAGENTRPNVSPDGRSVFFDSGRTGTTHIWQIDADGGDPRQLTDGDGFQTRPMASPDGKWVYFNWILGATSSIWKIPAGGGDAVRVSPHEHVEAFSISPDGRLLVFQQYDKAASTPWRFGIMRADTGETVRLIDAPMTGRITWTKNSAALIYVETPKLANLWQLPIDGGQPQQITSFDSQQIRSFDITPDGSTIVVSRGYSSTEAVQITGFH